MLVGDLLAYIDVFSVLFLLGILSRAATILFILKQAAARIGRLADRIMTQARRLDFRHRREGRSRGRQRLKGRPTKDDDRPVIVGGGVAWA